METNEKIKKKGIVKIIILIFLIATVIALAGLAYARYVTSIGGQTEVEIAKWNFKVTAGSSQSLNIDLADTRLVNDTTEVDRTKVAPGTKGALALNIDASGSQVSLKYDIDLTLTQIPENLIFYSDSNMTNAIYKENGIIHLDGYFGANDNNKTETKTLYWQWAMETGSTQAEIDTNDLLDSAWMGDEIILGIQATGQQVMENADTKYAVTFDANGGTLQGYGNASQTTKMVTYGETYGTLPIPTREGYTFAGWNGKNLVNISDHNVTFVNYYYINKTSNPKYILKLNTTYTLSFDYVVNSSTKEVYSSIGYGTYDYLKDVINPYASVYSESGRKVITATTPDTFNYSPAYVYFRFVRMSTPGDANVDISNVQFEEGSTATAYEPYYITSSTEVVQNNNHTLTAIWIEN